MNQNFDSQTLVRRLDGLIEAGVDDEILALHVDQGTCYGFNATAARVWSSLRQPKRIAELQAELLAEFDVDAETCERELLDVIGVLADQNLVAVSPAPDRDAPGA